MYPPPPPPSDVGRFKVMSEPREPDLLDELLLLAVTERGLSPDDAADIGHHANRLLALDCPNCYGRPRGQCPFCGTIGLEELT